MVMTDLALLEMVSSDLEWFRENREIKDQYEGQFVAIKERKILASATNLDKLREKLKNIKVNDSELLIKFVHIKNQIVIF